MRLVILSLAFLLTFLVHGFVYAETPSSGKIKRYKINVGKLKREIERHQGKIVQTDKKEKTLLEEIEELDNTIDLQVDKISAIKDQVVKQEELIANLEAKLVKIDEEKSNLQAHLLNRLKAYYFMGKTSFLNVTFSGKSLPDLLLFEDSFKDLVTYDRQIFDSYRDKKEQIRSVKEKHVMEKIVQVSFLHQADEEKQTLDFIAEQKTTFLNKTKSQKNLYSQALKEMQKAEDDLTSTIIQIKKKQEEKNKGFLNSKAKLQPPVAGTLLTRFKEGSNTDAALSNGITIETADGAKVHTVYKGKVIFAGYMKGFGKTLIVDHGLQYYSVTSRLDSIMVKKGDKVRQNQLVGNTGNIATLFGRGLYFEIRHGATPQDPLKWLASDSYNKKR